MLVQARGGRLRLIRQHDHALVAGALARAWVGRGSGAQGHPFRLVLATGLHDLAWRELDAEPRYDAETGRPLPFHAFPLEEKLAAYRSGVSRMEEISPWIGLLGSLHYASFPEGERADAFLRSEAERQDRLLRRLEARRRSPGEGGRESDSPGPPLRERAEADLAWLKFFDGLSIRLCLTPPPVPDAELPPWLDRTEAPEAPDGSRVATTWEGEATVRVDPPVFGDGLALEIPFRQLSAASYPDAGTLRAAWREAEERIWRLRVLPGG